MRTRLGEWPLLAEFAPSSFCKCFAVNSRRLFSPAVMPYCSAGWPVLGERKMSLSSLREISTGKVELSVNPAASEINFGRESAACMSHEIGGTAVRWPNLDRTFGFM